MAKNKKATGNKLVPSTDDVQNESNIWKARIAEKENEASELLIQVQNINIALNTGLRQGELLSLEWNRVNLFRKTILIQKTKNGKPKTLPLNKVALDVLNRRSKVKSIKNGLVFFNRNCQKIPNSNLRLSFHRVMRKVGIKDFRWHDLRHTFATRLAQADVDLYKISKLLLGHKDIKMTQRYSHHCPDSLRDGVEILETDYNLTTMDEKECSKSL